jgi:hypothetical protein
VYSQPGFGFLGLGVQPLIPYGMLDNALQAVGVG